MPEQAMILVAEPEEAIRESIEMILIDEGYDCHAVADTESLLRAIHIHEIDLIIADIQIVHPEIEPILEALREYKDSPDILITMTYERVRDMLDLIRYGIGEYLLKPFQFEELLERIDKLVAERNESRES